MSGVKIFSPSKGNNRNPLLTFTNRTQLQQFEAVTLVHRVNSSDFLRKDSCTRVNGLCNWNAMRVTVPRAGSTTNEREINQRSLCNETLGKAKNVRFCKERQKSVPTSAQTGSKSCMLGQQRFEFGVFPVFISCLS